MRVLRIAAAALLLCIGGAASGAPPAAGTAVPWRLDPSDLARYDRGVVKAKKGGGEDVHVKDQVAIDGRHLDDRGLVVPGCPSRDDLAEILALSTPGAPGEWRIDLLDAAEVRVRATAPPPAADAKDLAFDYEFASGRASKTDVWLVRGGTAHVRLTFDAAEGVPRKSRVDLAYDLEPAERGKDRKPSRVEQTWNFDLLRVFRARHEKFQDEVDAAIDKGVAHLRTLQKDDGNFEKHGDWEAGTTALAAYTLVSCDVPVTDPAVDKALTLVVQQTGKRTYELAVGLMAMERAYAAPRGTAERLPIPDDRRAWCLQAAAQLEANAGSPGTWSYPPKPGYIAEPDSSNTQYAALGLLAATKFGYEVKETSWTGLVRHFERVRQDGAPKGEVTLLPEGTSIRATVPPTSVASAAGFRYRTAEDRVWESMTCAGISSLEIARSELRRAKSRKMTALEAPVAEMIAGGWAWLDRHWRVDRHTGHPGNDWHYYALYSLERAGILCGVLRVGGRDWYYQGAVELIARQQADGKWDEKGGDHTTETCFALLFLKRATPPLTGR